MRLRIFKDGRSVEVDVDDGIMLLDQCRTHAGAMTEVLLHDRDQREPALIWCRERLGDTALRWNQRGRHASRGTKFGIYTFHPVRPWFSVGVHFLIRDPDMAFEFKMRWG